MIRDDSNHCRHYSPLNEAAYCISTWLRNVAQDAVVIPYGRTGTAVSKRLYILQLVSENEVLVKKMIKQ